MFYTLKSNLELRSYDNKPFVIFNKETKNIFEVSQLSFEALKLCDGSNDLASLPIYEKLLKYGIIECVREKQVPHLDYKKYDNRYFSAGWSLTRNCNFRCKHCFVKNDEQANYKEFTTQECFRIIDQLKSCGINLVGFFGGEPFIRKDFWQIVDYMLKQDIIFTGVYTNASLVDDALLKKLEERNLNPTFFISFDGVGYHDFMRNRVGAEKEVLEKMRLIASKGFKIICIMSAFKENLSSIFQTIDVLSDVGVDTLQVQPVLPSNNWLRRGYDFVTNDDMLKCGLEVLKKFCSGQIDMNITFVSRYSATKSHIDFLINEDVNTKQLTCDFWRNSIFITPEGKVVPCPMINFDNIFDADVITEKPLQQILNAKKYLDLVDIDLEAIKIKDNCNTCNAKSKCMHRDQICLAPSYFTTGGLKSMDPQSTCDFMQKYVDEYERLAQAYNQAVASK